MVFDIHEVGGIGEFITEEKTLGDGDDAEKVLLYEVASEEPKTFLVVRKNTLEVRTDGKLKNLLRDRYESVMESRYFGKGGIEIVNSGQLTADEINDLVRLSYQLSEVK